MAIYNTATITTGTNGKVTVADYTAFSINFRGYNPDIPAGSVIPTTFNSRPIRFVQWSSTLGLQIAFGSNGGNTGWTTVTVNNTSFSRTSGATYTAWDGTQEVWRWNGVSNPFPTTGTFTLDFIGNLDAEYGFNAAAFGSMTNTTYRDFGIQLVFHNPSTDILSLGLTNAVVGGVPINGKWGYITVGGTKYYREDASVSNIFGVAVFSWTGITVNPFGTSIGGFFPTRTFSMGYEDPDTTVSVNAPTEIALSDTQFPVTVSGIDSPFSGRLYGVKLDGTDTSELTGTAPFETTTGANNSSVVFEVTSNLPSSGSSETYYLYAARTGDTGGAGGTNNEGPAAWVYTGNSFSVTRSSTDNVNITPEARPAASYGFRAYNSSGNVVVEHSSRVPRFVASGSQTVGANSTSDVSISGITADGTWLVFLVARTAISSGLAFFSETIFTGYFRIFNSADQSRDFDYWVVNIG